MGNLRSAEKALEHVGAEAEITSDHERIRGRRRDRAARRGRVPQGDGGGAAARLRRAAARAPRRRRAGARHLPGHAAAVRVHHRARRRRGHRPARGARWTRSTRPASRCRRSAGTRCPGGGETPLRDELPDPCAFYHVHSFAPRPPNDDDVAGTAAYGSEFVSVVAAAAGVRRAVPPREVRARRAAAAAQLRQPLRARGGMILLPAVDIRDGKAVRLRQGRFDEETVYADDPLEAARSFVEAGARFLHVVDLDGARDGEPANLDHLRADHPRGRRAGAVRRRPARRWCPSARPWRPARSAWWWARPPTPTPTSSRRRSRPGTRACSWPSTCAAARCPCRAGRARRRCAPRI